MVYDTNNALWAYEYDLKDHLGNTRCSFSADNTHVSVLQTKDYYPFGLEMTNGYKNDAGATKFLYNGKELQDEAGLDWYDYGARFYDPVIGRWHSIDPHGENYYSWSPYNYVANNPLIMIDPDGRDWYANTNGTGTMWRNGSAEIEGYKNLGTSYTQKVGNGVSITFTQNAATSMTFTGIDGSNYVSQTTGTGCKTASDQMLSNEGVNSKGERINVVNADANGVATTANGNATKGIKAVDNALENGNPIEVGVDYQSKQTHNLDTKHGEDAMTDHFIVVSSKTEQLNNGQVTSKV